MKSTDKYFTCILLFSLIFSCEKKNREPDTSLECLKITFNPSLFESSELTIDFNLKELNFYGLKDSRIDYELSDNELNNRLSLNKPISISLNDIQIKTITKSINSFKSVDLVNSENNDLYDGMDISLNIKYNNYEVKTLHENNSTNRQVQLYKLLFDIIRHNDDLQIENEDYLVRLGF
jgi:hypothetical protein